MHLGLAAGQHIAIRATIQGKSVQRNYTPISSDWQRGYFELMIKTYPDGNISKYMDGLGIGDLVEISGPRGRYLYKANQRTQLCMIAGGTGITPMLQIIRQVFRDPKDRTELFLIFANVTLQDILLKTELDELASEHPNRFAIKYVLNVDPSDETNRWSGGIGFVTAEVIRAHFPPAHSDMQILLCGPPPMVKAVSDACASLGYNPAGTVSSPADMIFKF